MKKSPEGEAEYPLETGREWSVGIDEDYKSVAEVSGVDGPYPGDPYRLADFLHLVIPGPRPAKIPDQ